MKTIVSFLELHLASFFSQPLATLLCTVLDYFIKAKPSRRSDRHRQQQHRPVVFSWRAVLFVSRFLRTPSPCRRAPRLIFRYDSLNNRIHWATAAGSKKNRTSFNLCACCVLCVWLEWRSGARKITLRPPLECLEDMQHTEQHLYVYILTIRAVRPFTIQKTHLFPISPILVDIVQIGAGKHQSQFHCAVAVAYGFVNGLVTRSRCESKRVNRRACVCFFFVYMCVCMNVCFWLCIIL